MPNQNAYLSICSVCARVLRRPDLVVPVAVGFEVGYRFEEFRLVAVVGDLLGRFPGEDL